jgi:hypothetical protein
MDHRCLYGHRVPATFAFAIQNRLCPMCGAATVTVAGYQVARKLTTDANLDAVQAFNVIKVIESEWVLQPAGTDHRPVGSNHDGEETGPATVKVDPPKAESRPRSRPEVVAKPEPTSPQMDEVEVVEEAVMEPVDEVISLPEPKVKGPATVAVVPIAPSSPVNITSRTSKPVSIPTKPGFDTAEEEFFKG